MWTSGLSLIAATVLGGLLPLLGTRHPDRLHRLVALATGLFLGIVFLHVLPEALGHGGAHALHGESTEPGLEAPWPAVVVLAGALGLYLLEHLALPGREQSDPHVRVGWRFFVGLSLHAMATGLGLAPAGGELSGGLVTSLLPHKAAEGFSIASILSLAGGRRVRVIALVVLFSLATPAGLLLGGQLYGVLGAAGRDVFQALAAGTFLVVAVTDLLPELLHEGKDTAWRVALLALGIVSAAFLH